MKLLLMILWLLFPICQATEISFTMDDPNMDLTPSLSPIQRNDKILDAFDSHSVKGALFVCGKRIDNSEGKNILKSWDRRGHLIANHSYSHLSLNSNQTTLTAYMEDLLKVEPLIIDYKHFVKLYRFPFLKEGDTREKRDSIRALLKREGYVNGYVTIDASDWYVDQRLRERLNKNPKVDLQPYRDFYLKHMWERAQYYDNLAHQMNIKKVKHTLLIHHNLLNALFLDDLMSMFEARGWKLISAKEAFRDPVRKKMPDIIPAGESLIWALAKETRHFDAELRYPGEDGDYEKAEMDGLGL